jgi:hypothetical protein
MGHPNSKNHAGGRPAADDLDDARRCDFVRTNGERCGNPASAFGERQRCRFHGGERDSVAKEEMRVMAAELNLPKPVTRGDFETVAAEFIARYNLMFERLYISMEQVRVDFAGDDIETVREYGDIFARMDTVVDRVTRMMSAAATLGLVGSAENLLNAIAAQSWVSTRLVVADVLADYPEARQALADRLAAEQGALPLPVLDAEIL